MDEQTIREIIRGSRRGLGAGAVRAALAAASAPYAGAVRLRRWAYRVGLVPSVVAPVPVISVGNITTGGTGKTPMVAWVVARLVALGRRPAVLTRGYKAVGGKSDEAELLLRTCGAPVVVSAGRVAGARQAAINGADSLVMDDGFQHIRLRRDLDIVLIDATDPFGGGRVLPRGLLREPLCALRDAGAVVVTRSDRVAPAELQALRCRLRRLAPDASLHAAVHQAVKLVDENGSDGPLSELAGRRVFAFCGLGNPQAFFATVAGLGAELVGIEALDDHATYSRAVVEAIARSAKSAGAELLLTTQKDAVKLSGASPGLPLRILVVEMRVVEGEAELAEGIRAAVRGKS